MENNRILPVGLKGKEVDNRMRELMGISNIDENTVISTPSYKNVSVQLTKIGPDGKAYAIVRENHNHYIKIADKTTGLVVEDFKYIGGLMNKKDQAYPSYARAIKFLNLRFTSIAESRNIELDINTFVDDNLLGEGYGFSGAGNLEGQTPLWEEEFEETEVVEGADEADADELLASDESTDNELSEAEKAIDAMISEVGEKDVYRNGEKIASGVKFYPNNKDYDSPTKNNSGINVQSIKSGDQVLDTNNSQINEHKLTAGSFLVNMDSIIDSLVEGTLKKKVYTLK